MSGPRREDLDRIEKLRSWMLSPWLLPTWLEAGSIAENGYGLTVNRPTEAGWWQNEQYIGPTLEGWWNQTEELVDGIISRMNALTNQLSGMVNAEDATRVLNNVRTDLLNACKLYGLKSERLVFPELSYGSYTDRLGTHEVFKVASEAEVLPPPVANDIGGTAAPVLNIPSGWVPLPPATPENDAPRAQPAPLDVPAILRPMVTPVTPVLTAAPPIVTEAVAPKTADEKAFPWVWVLGAVAAITVIVVAIRSGRLS